ncbi:MAG: DUF2950 domain-containing protein [Acidobacteriia bacterium]|nr:DUF2950 domain-containing protein [Terriglobia bacterium]
MKALILISTAFALAQAQQSYPTPEAAAAALIDAATNNNGGALSAIFGAQGSAILTGGSAEQDKAERQEFASIAKNKHQLERDSMNPDRMILSIGSEDWPFPVPIVRQNGQWHFDTATGKQMMQARRIGADELDAIEICAGYVGAQMQYAQQHRMQEYAPKLDTLGELIPAGMIQAGLAAPKAYHGYYFRVLTSQGPNASGGAHNYVVKDTMLGGFALVAWPAEYGVSGVHTFIVNQDGMIYEKNLGRPASHAVPPVNTYDPDKSWRPVY